jgi:hypothetical protein
MRVDRRTRRPANRVMWERLYAKAQLTDADLANHSTLEDLSFDHARSFDGDGPLCVAHRFCSLHPVDTATVRVQESR